MATCCICDTRFDEGSEGLCLLMDGGMYEFCGTCKDQPVLEGEDGHTHTVQEVFDQQDRQSTHGSGYSR